MTKKSSFAPFGVSRNRLYWQVSNILCDEDFIYIKILCDNRSGHLYQISNGKAIFEYREGKSRNLRRREASIRVDGLVACQAGKDRIGAYSEQELGYAVKSYPLNRRGKLLISFIEAGGKRNYQIKVPFSYLEKIQAFHE